jgi:hypothetical protein
VSYPNLLKIKVILDFLVEFSVIFSETEIKLEVMDRNQDLVHFQDFILEDRLIVEEKEVPNLNGGLQIRITNLIITMAEVSAN